MGPIQRNGSSKLGQGGQTTMHRSTSTTTQKVCRRLAWWSLLLIGLIPASIVFMMVVGIVGNAFNLLERADDYITDPNSHLPYVVVCGPQS